MILAKTFGGGLSVVLAIALGLPCFANGAQ